MDWDGTFSGSARNGFHAFSYPMYVGLKHLFDGVLAKFAAPVDFGWEGTARGPMLSWSQEITFDVLGIDSHRKNTDADDDKLKAASHTWCSAINMAEAVRRKFISIEPDYRPEYHPMTVVGVVQRGFRGTEVGSPTDLFIPMMMKPQVTPTWDDMGDRRSIWVNIMARLKPNVSRKQAEAAMTVLYHEEQADGNGRNAAADCLRQRCESACGASGDAAKRDLDPPFTGASKGAIFRLVLIESLLIASSTGSLLLRFLPSKNVGKSCWTSPGSRVLLFTLALCVLTAVIFGSLPALQIINPDVVSALKNKATAIIGSSHVKLRRALVAAQISLSLLWLIGAGLFANINLMQVNSGMRTEPVLSFLVDPSLPWLLGKESAPSCFSGCRKRSGRLPEPRLFWIGNPILTNESWISKNACGRL